MAHFHKNLLEAFQDADDERVGGDPVSGGPFAGAPPDEPHARAARVPTSLLPPLSLRDTRVLFAFGAVALFAFVAGLAVGRGVGGGASAAERSDGPALELPGANGATGAKGAPETPGSAGSWSGGSELAAGEPVNDALRDPRNAFTVLAVTYGDSEAERDLAYATYYHFAELGLPVAYPVTLSSYIYVLVGAAPSRADLGSLRDAVRAARDPDGRAEEYAEAYVVGIDSVFPR